VIRGEWVGPETEERLEMGTERSVRMWEVVWRRRGGGEKRGPNAGNRAVDGSLDDESTRGRGKVRH
jgi:hypothetical protein